MNTLNRFKACLAAATVVALPILSNGCSAVQDAQGAVCCTEFKAGGTVDAKISANVETQTVVQAVADFSGIASAAIDDITAACRGIATDLDADKTMGDAAEANTDKQAKMNAWCKLAVDTIGSLKASANASFTLAVVPPQCSLNVSAKANCSAKCSGSASCDFKANPPKCTGGKLEVSCKGECKAKAGAELSCTGTCAAECKGSCTAMGGVDCAGKCDGTCMAKAGASGSGVDAQGNCQGTCMGTCAVTAPSAKCTGSCSGTCSGSCMGSASASVKCDGDCTGDVEPLKCEGGKLEGGCMASASCDANCDASVSAKAECTPASVTVQVTGSADANVLGKLKAALEANLPLIFQFKERLKAMTSVAATITGDVSAFGDIKAACIIDVGAAAAAAVSDVSASVSASASVVTAVGGS
jgi:hypothetical protein